MDFRAIGSRSPWGTSGTRGSFAVPGYRIRAFSAALGRAGGRPFFVALPGGVVVSQRGYVALMSADLSDAIWRVEAANGDDWASLGVWDGQLVTRSEGRLVWRTIATGEMVRVIDAPRGTIASMNGAIVVMYVAGRAAYEAVDQSGRVIWQHESGPWLAVSNEEYVLIVEDFGRRLACVEAATGRRKWAFVVPTVGAGYGRHEIIVGDAGVAIVGREVVLTIDDGRVLAVSLDTGEVVRGGKLPMLGNLVVDEEVMYLQEPFSVSVYDYRVMEEVARIEYRGEAAELYGSQPASANAFCVSVRAIVWTTMQGVLMGVARHTRDGHRESWKEAIPGAVMPLAAPPVISGEYLYYAPVGEGMPLMAWRSGAGW